MPPASQRGSAHLPAASLRSRMSGPLSIPSESIGLIIAPPAFRSLAVSSAAPSPASAPSTHPLILARGGFPEKSSEHQTLSPPNSPAHSSTSSPALNSAVPKTTLSAPDENASLASARLLTPP